MISGSLWALKFWALFTLFPLQSHLFHIFGRLCADADFSNQNAIDEDLGGHKKKVFAADAKILLFSFFIKNLSTYKN